MKIADLDLRPAVLGDAEAAAEIFSAQQPDEPHDPVLIRHWWSHPDPHEVMVREILETEGRVVGILRCTHTIWEKMPERYGHLQLSLHPDARSRERIDAVLDHAHLWLAGEGARIASTWIREYEVELMREYLRRGYVETRRGRCWELDLVEHGEALRTLAEESRLRMREAGIRLATMAAADRPGIKEEIHRAFVAQAQDEPTTVPHVPASLEAFDAWFQSPGLRPDRIWLAFREDRVVGESMLSYPPTIGNIWTNWTGTSREVRGLGVARALKVETLVQALDLGVVRVRTGNDSENAPILHINEMLGYRPIPGEVELHREL